MKPNRTASPSKSQDALTLRRSPRFSSGKFDSKMDKSNMVMGDPKQSQALENKLLDEVVESQGEEPTSAASGKENADVNEGDHAKSVANNNFDFVKEQTAAGTNDGGFEEENFPGNGIVGESAHENVSREEDPTEIVAENKRPQKIVDEDGNPVTNVSEEEKLGECSTMEKISSENGQVPTELSAIEAPLNEGDPAHAEDEKMIDVIHEVDDETAKDELKEPDSKIVSASIVTDRNSRFSETADPLNEGDPAQPEDENMVDVVHENKDEMVDERQESDNQNVSSSSVTHGNPKLSETAASVEEGGPAQDEDEKMADVVHENKDVTVKDELKEPGDEIVSASAVTDGNLKFSGHAIPVNEGDPAQPEDEKIADVVRGNEDHDKLKEPGDQIVSAGNVIDGNAKLSESAAPLKEGDPMQTEIEKISNVVHENEDETVINKLKGPGIEICSASSATDGNDKSSESAIPMTEGDTLHPEEEKIADVDHENEDKTVHSNLKEPGNEIDSTSDVTCGNAKLSESATPLDEDNPAQPEDEKMSDVVCKNQDEIVDDKLKGPDNEIVSASTHTIGNAKLSESASVNEGDRAQPEEEQIADVIHENEDKTVHDKLKEPGNEIVSACAVTYRNAKLSETTMKSELDDASLPVTATPNSLVKYSTSVTGDHSEEIVKTISHAEMVEDNDGTPEDQVAFMKELERFYREKSMDFKPLKFYGQPLNCLKLWRAVIRLGGYDRVTGLKLWRQVGESFHPPKTCTTVSWTFRIFYEKSLLEYERHKTQSGELQLPDFAVPDAAGVYVEGNGHQGLGSGRTRRDAAARAMQGWHVQRVSGHGEVGEPIIKDKNLSNVIKREKNLKSIGSLKQKRPNEEELSVKAARTETSKQPVASVVDVGPPADWVRINVQQAKDCFEVYALVPGLLREEVRVQSDPAGRLVITGQPEHLDNPWGITPFRKVVTFPTRIDPVRTSAVVSLHGRLLIRVPFEQ